MVCKELSFALRRLVARAPAALFAAIMVVVVVCGGLSHLQAAGPSSGDGLPYTARVVGEDVYVRSGPGTDYYPTAKLQTGDEVEVFRRDPGGWCAVRPPRGSFCYVALGKLKPLGQGVAVARENKVEAHVGSSLGDMRDVIQVRLDHDEPVEVLEEPDHDRDDAWVKIAPPAGEFRWISSRYIERSRPATAGRGGQRGSFAALPEPRRWTDESIANSAGVTSGPRTSVAGWSRPGGRDTSGKDASGRGGASELEQMNQEISRRVVLNVSQWQFDDLKQRGQRALDSATNDADRDDAQHLLDKIARFEDIRQRREAFDRGSLGPGAVASNVALPGSSLAAAPAAVAIPSAPTVDPRYDGAGRLTPVVSQKTGAPQFALVDANGAVIQFVSPAPGVNLQPYMYRRIGVSGPRNFAPEYQRQVINAQRITLLDDGSRRF